MDELEHEATIAHLRIGIMKSKQKVKEKTWLSDKTLSFALTCVE